MTRRSPNSRKPGATPPGRVRIVAGKWRGRFLPVTDVDELRPTSERIRETLFNWLAPQIEGSRCLDLFAGTGVLGLEALSRGAAEAVLVEQSVAAIDALRGSIDQLRATAVTVIAGDALDYLRHAEPVPMDIVFLDPPFRDQSLDVLCALLDSRHWLAARASVYLEQDARRSAPGLPRGWTVRREKKAGNVRYLLVDAQRPAAMQDTDQPEERAG
jgi:16S rRNA (guanine966-N2)-methyltransferase